MFTLWDGYLYIAMNTPYKVTPYANEGLTYCSTRGVRNEDAP